MEQHKAERRAKTQRVITTATTRARARAPESLCGSQATPPTSTDEIDSTTYDAKVRINHWRDAMMEHKKIYYAAELKMFKLELALAKYDNSNKLRWSVRHREMANMVRHADEEKRRTPEPAFGYVPITRRLKSESEPDDEANGSRSETIEGETESVDAGADDEGEIRSRTSDRDVVKNDVIPIHSEDYKPFSNTASIHSYMYHLRKIYGK